MKIGVSDVTVTFLFHRLMCFLDLLSMCAIIILLSWLPFKMQQQNIADILEHSPEVREFYKIQ